MSRMSCCLSFDRNPGPVSGIYPDYTGGIGTRSVTSDETDNTGSALLTL